ncbi:cobyric acid synthase [Desulfovibrio psychrotolerans]|uniref:Cobyric acid synthase n=1 Tax=Desulfovibrio psychrotolerans TaxID=415242 RepID=A0A7J0BQI7_9BACT|nr:cobyric acid synthase [Desulfovibrio psychrotolerans]GFM35918.1 cobyric acid synthase [Desulfovibrio psychrotolerans]
MLQGTSSNAGKSVLTAALCRILLQDGFSVAPFKAQNMALNSFVTPDGREIGRAQAVQAAACRLEPDARMNPVLLKPNSDTGSQVIVMGHPVGNMRVKEYTAYKAQAFSTVCTAYDSLAAEHDILVLEGAGSPAEINLKAHDIVNMRMAQYARAKVLLVADIDRGGVFASLVGTMELLDGWERDLVAGFVLNRFRGDASLLDPALAYTTRRTGKPFLGVVPEITALGLPEEDSVSFREGLGGRTLRRDALRIEAGTAGIAGVVDIALVDLPHIANFTDVDALAGEPDVSLRVVRHPGELGQPDCVILPGSKNTLGDLAWLRTSGLADALLACADARTGSSDKLGGPEIVGICGGLQMLGQRVEDPHSVESDRAAGLVCSSGAGLGLLAVHTVMGADKVLARVTATHTEFGLPLRGYEIHHGQTRVTDSSETRACVVADDGPPIGYTNDRGVWGTYLHGLFDADAFRRAFIDRLRVRRGLPPVGRVVAPYGLEPALDRLADAVRAALDMEAVYRLLGIAPR